MAPSRRLSVKVVKSNTNIYTAIKEASRKGYQRKKYIFPPKLKILLGLIIYLRVF